MNQNRKATALRVGATAAAMSIATVVAAPSPAGAAAAPGAGQAEVATTILDARLGQLLGLEVLTDKGRATSDAALGSVGGLANVTKLKVSSSVAALNHTVGEHAVASPGPNSEVQTSLVDLGAISGLSAVATGTIEPVLLRAQHNPLSATLHTARITDLGLLGGIANVGVLQSGNKTGSGTAAAEATRDVAVDAITVLKLGDLLKLLGIDLLQLPLEVIESLLGSLGISLDGILPDGQTDLSDAINGLIDAVQAVLPLDEVEPTIASVFGALPSDVTEPLGLTSTTPVNDAIDTLQSTLLGILQPVLDLLDNAALLQVKALDVAVVTKATDSVGSSVATATGRLGAIKVGNLAEIPGVDVLATAAQVNALLAQVQGALDGVLGVVGLDGILELKLFDKQTAVTQEGGAVKAVSSITGLKLRVNLPSNITSIVSGLNGSLSPVTGLVDGLTTDGAPLAGILPAGGIAALGSQPIALDLVRVASTSQHSVPARPILSAPGAPTSLPRTGGGTLPLTAGAVLLGAAALGSRRVLRRSRTGA